MEEYHKIQTVFKRDPETKFKTLLEGDYALPEFEYLANCEWAFTEKVDGTNIRVMFDAGGETLGPMVRFGGRTDRAQIQTTLFDILTTMFATERLKEVFPEGGACLYGEGYGPKIQKSGGNYRSDQSFVLFDVRVGDWWLNREDVEDVASKLGIDVVPTIGTGRLVAMTNMCRNGFDSQWGRFPAEGVVARPMTELQTRSGHRIITKLKCKDFTH